MRRVAHWLVTVFTLTYYLLYTKANPGYRCYFYTGPGSLCDEQVPPGRAGPGRAPGRAPWMRPSLAPRSTTPC
jgi:hypothetical protein